MEILILLLLSPAVFALKNTNPNDEPFLPIYPIFPYNPKLMKRGTERDFVTQLKPELYSPKPDQNYPYYPGGQRDPYYPNYNIYAKSPSSATTPYSPYYVPNTYSNYSPSPYGTYADSYMNSPYPTNPYSGGPYVPNPYTSAAYASNPYSSYYQTPQFHPNYYNYPYPYPPMYPNPDPNGSPKPEAPVLESKKPDKDKRLENAKQRTKDAGTNGNQYIDGTNYISSNSKDLSYNQLEQLTLEQNLRGASPLSLPQTTYKVISVGGQPVAPNYPLPTSYMKTQNPPDQNPGQTLAKGQELPEVPYSLQGSNQNNVGKGVEGQVYNQNALGQSHPVGQHNSGKPNEGLFFYANQNVPLTKTTAKYQEVQHGQKPAATRVTFEESHGVYIPPSKNGKNQQQPVGSGSFPDGQGQNHEVVPQTQSTGNYREQNYNYAFEGGQAPVSYQNQNPATVQAAPQTQPYQYQNFHPVQQGTSPAASQFQTTLEDVNFGAKVGNKG